MKKMILVLCVVVIFLVLIGVEYVMEGFWQVKKEENKMIDMIDVVVINRLLDVYMR